MNVFAAIFLILVLSVALAWVFHWKVPEWEKTMRFFRNNIGVGAAVLAAWLAYLEVDKATASYALSVSQHADEVRHRKQTVAFELAREFSELPHLTLIADAIEAHKSLLPEEIEKKTKEDKALWGALRDTLNFFEQAAMATKLSYADESTMCELLAGPIGYYYSSLEAWIEHHRKVNDKQGAWQHGEWLYKKWQKGCPSGAGTEQPAEAHGSAGT